MNEVECVFFFQFSVFFQCFLVFNVCEYGKEHVNTDIFPSVASLLMLGNFFLFCADNVLKMRMVGM